MEEKDFNETRKVLESFEKQKEVLSSVQLSSFQKNILAQKKDYSKVLEQIGFKPEKEMKIEAPKIQIQKEEALNLFVQIGSFVYLFQKVLLNAISSFAKKSSELKISLTLLPLKTIGVKKQLVLVNLPINEQIRELEQIIFGLINAEFNEEELKIIKREVEGLYIEVQRTKIDLSKLSDSERAMIETRNNALERVRRLLRGEE